VYIGREKYFGIVHTATFRHCEARYSCAVYPNAEQHTFAYAGEAPGMILIPDHRL
jgi:hypothetical protein